MRTARLSAAALWALFALPLAASAGTAEGLGWLATQSNANGSFGSTTTLLATEAQTTAEVLRAYQALGQQSQLPYTPALSYVNTDTEANTEFLSRKIVINAQGGADVSVLLNTLLTHQNADGDFGDQAGYDSAVLDTAYALEALASANQAASQSASAAVGYLLYYQQASGGWKDGDNESSVYLAALSMRALWPYRHHYLQVPAALDKAKLFLLSQRDASGSWGETFNTALALTALIPYLPDLSPVQGSITGLQSAQLANGSFDNDPYTTALVLQALYLASLPQPNPDYVSIKGKVIEAQTGLPLSGVTVTLSGAVSRSAVTQTDGAFEFLSLPTGSYTLTLSLANYGTVTTVITAGTGQAFELGVLQLAKASGATTGTVVGVVTEAASGAPLSGVSVSISGVAGSALTDATGRYQITNVSPGVITVSTVKAGYAAASASASLASGGVLIFSPALITGATDTAIAGIVTEGATGLPLSGAQVSVSGAASATAYTDAAGQYRLTGLAPGAVTISASRSGYDSVTRSATLFGGNTLVFSPKFYLAGTTPPDANTTGVEGVVYDAGANTPLAGATVTAVSGGITQTRQTDAAGHYAFSDLAGAEASLKFAASGYVGTDLTMPLAPLTILDIGQVRLRKEKATALLPDLTVSAVDRAGTSTDPKKLTISGALTVTISNAGTAVAESGVSLLAFYDANRNGAYDEGIDARLGQAQTAEPIAPGASAQALIPVAGALPFRDAPIHVWADFNRTVVELKETNNVNVTASACVIEPLPAGKLDPVLKWHWSGSTVDPSYNQVMSAPVVAQLNDDNGDGRIDASDIPDVIFTTFARSYYEGPGVLRAVSGADGHEIWDPSAPTRSSTGFFGPAVGDIDGDGLVEIVVGRPYMFGLIAYEHDGTKKWSQYVPSHAQPALADIDGDGKVEIIYGRRVYNANSTLRWGYDIDDPVPLVADIDGDGYKEIVSNGVAYDKDGKVKWDSGRRGLWGAIGNFDDDEFPEIAIRTPNSVTLLEHTGAVKWGPVAIPGGGGGPLTVADLDGDGAPEIGVAGASNYTVIETDGSIKWTSGTRDYSSAGTGSSVFDFEGDGKAEILYGDELNFRIYDGSTGKVLYQTPNPSGTLVEYPLVVDVDNDGHAEIVLVANNYAFPGVTGIRVFENRKDDWMPTRAIWNQHAYHIDNVNDDGTIPRSERSSWLSHNSFRLNTFPDRSALVAPDLTAGMLKLIDNGLGQPPSLTLRIGNAGSTTAPASSVTFYMGDPAAGGAALGSLSLAPLAGGDYRDLRLDNVTLAGSADLYAVVDPQNKASECNETNNTVWAPATASTPLGRIAVSTDALAYGAYSAVQISATATNLGALPGIFSVALRIEDSNGFAVSDLASRSLGTLAGGAAQSLADTWNTGTTLAGSYRVRATLLGASGEVVHEATTSFEIRHPEGAGPAVMLRLTTDRSVYYTTDLANIQSLIGNVTPNTIVDNAVIRITIYDPAGQVVLQRDGALGQLLPGSVRDMVLPYAFQGAAVAVFRVRGEVLDASSAVLASAETRYEVRFDLDKALAGRVEAAAATLEAGATQTCTYNLTNTGTLAVAGLGVRYALANMDTQQWIQEEAKTLSLRAGEQNTYVRGFATTGLTPGHYACVLLAQVDGAMKTLAYAPFTLTEPPVKINAALSLGPKGRLLVLLDAPRAGALEDSPSERATQDANPDRDPHGPDSAPGLSAQRAFIERLLTQSGWSYTIAESAEAFTRELRSGGYSAYALFSEHEKLAEDAQKELREAIYRGEGLMVAGAHDSRHDQLWETLGLTYKGQITHAEAASLAGLELTGEIALLAGDSVLRISRESAESLATYRLASGADACEGAANSAKNLTGCVALLDAFTLNNHGQGKGLFAGFDLLVAATRSGEGGLAAQFLLKALSAVHPAALDTAVQRVVPVELVLSNEGIATSVKAILTLPEGVSLIEAAGATVQGNTLTWETALGVAEQKRLSAYLRLPADPGSLTVAAQVLAPKGGVETLIATVNLSFTVTPAPGLATITATLESLASADQSLNPAVQHLRQAETELAANRHAEALHGALLAADVLASRASSDTASVRGELARWIRWLEMTIATAGTP